MDIRRDILWRVYLSFIGIGLLSMLVLGRAIYIQRVQGSYWRSMSDSLHQRIQEISPDRGTIYSEDGQMLSTSLPEFDIYMDFAADGLREKDGKRFRENLDSFAYHMAVTFGEKSKAAYVSELKKAFKEKRRYFLLKKKMSFEEYKRFREFPLVRLGRNRSGVIAEVNSKRLMPYGLMANRTIGLARKNADNVGLERTYDSLLKGQTGKRLVRFIAGGAAVPVDGYMIEPENGKDIVTTLDVQIQDIAQTALMRKMTESEAQYGTCIVMETKTGKIKAIANLGRQTDGNYWEDYNYALRTTEPGSTIKLATLLATLSEGTVRPNDLVEVGTAGHAMVGNVRDVPDAERSPKPVLTVKECFAHSSNVGMGKLAYKTFGSNPAKFKDYLTKYHLDQRTGIDLIGEEKPRHAVLKKNREGLIDLVTMSFGYAIRLSPLQTLTFYNAIANNGRMMKPYLVNRILQNGIPVKEFQPEVLEERIADEAVIRTAKESMEMVITEGTGRPAFQGINFPVAGKTGTAHVADGKIQYADRIYQASFVGYFPANDPQYTCIVVIRTQPHAFYHYGGQLAAPVFREIATKLYNQQVEKKAGQQITFTSDSSQYMYAGNGQAIRKVYADLGMSYRDSSNSKNWSRVSPEKGYAIVREIPQTPAQLPDLTGMGLKDALLLLESKGVTVQVSGKGKVKQQSLPAGTTLTKGMVIQLTLG
ncbi:MAG: transpeptidase family protein [Chitinophagales bacterium]|nr:transpeptidase family protein [Chitinophagales bacterium]